MVQLQQGTHPEADGGVGCGPGARPTADETVRDI